MSVKCRDALTAKLGSPFPKERRWVLSAAGKGMGLGDVRPEAELQCGSTPVENDLFMDYSATRRYRFIWHSESGHTAVIWDIILSFLFLILLLVQCLVHSLKDTFEVLPSSWG